MRREDHRTSGPRWRVILEARWRDRLQEVTGVSLAYHDAAIRHVWRHPGHAGTPADPGLAPASCPATATVTTAATRRPQLVTNVTWSHVQATLINSARSARSSRTIISAGAVFMTRMDPVTTGVPEDARRRWRPPGSFSRMTLRPLGPSVDVTASVSLSTPPAAGRAPVHSPERSSLAMDAPHISAERTRGLTGRGSPGRGRGRRRGLRARRGRRPAGRSWCAG
jgi:hypothetical protein